MKTFSLLNRHHQLDIKWIHNQFSYSNKSRSGGNKIIKLYRRNKRIGSDLFARFSRLNEEIEVYRLSCVLCVPDDRMTGATLLWLSLLIQLVNPIVFQGMKGRAFRDPRRLTESWKFSQREPLLVPNNVHLPNVCENGFLITEEHRTLNQLSVVRRIVLWCFF